jgi:hypothetical protein
MKTIFITIFDGAIAMNILRTDAFKTLKKQNDLRIILLIPYFRQVDYYKKLFEDLPKVVVEGIKRPRPKGLKYAFLRLFKHAFATETIKMGQVTALLRDKNLIKFTVFRIVNFFAANSFVRIILRKIDSTFFPGIKYQYLFDKYKPDILFAANILALEDTELIRCAKRNGTKTIGMVKSWDNLTSKGVIRNIETDKLIVQNEIVRQEAVKLQDFPPEKIYISGVPQWDIYFDKSIISSREEFFKKIGADPKKKLLFFCSPGDEFGPHDGENLEILDQAITEGKINYPTQILVRPHPKYAGLDEKAKNCPNAILDRPGKYATKHLATWDFQKDDILHLANSLYHCDLIINTASTTTIEACIYDKPVINIAFDGYQKKNYYQSVKRYYSFNHYQNIVKARGTKVVKNPDEFISAVNAYLSNPRLDEKGRKRIAKEQCYKLDGGAGTRIAQLILDFI